MPDSGSFELCFAHAVELLLLIDPDPLVDDALTHHRDPPDPTLPHCQPFDPLADADLAVPLAIAAEDLIDLADPDADVPELAIAAEPEAELPALVALAPVVTAFDLAASFVRRKGITLEHPTTLDCLEQRDREYAEQLMADGEHQEEAIARALACRSRKLEHEYSRVIAFHGPSREWRDQRLLGAAASRNGGIDG